MDRLKEWSNIRSGSHNLSLRVDHDPQKFQCSSQMPIYKECPRQLDLRWPTTHTALADQMIKVWPNVENFLLKSSELFLQAFDSLWGNKRFCEFPAVNQPSWSLRFHQCNGMHVKGQNLLQVHSCYLWSNFITQWKFSSDPSPIIALPCQ